MTYAETKLFIHGQWRTSSDGKQLPVVNPATGLKIGDVAHASISDLDAALNSVQKGFVTWRNVGAQERGKIIHKAAALLRERSSDIAKLMTLEQGKPIAESKGEVLSGADMLDWFAEEGTRTYGRIVASRVDPAIRQMVLKDPVGPVAAFTPWNFPINQIVRKVGAGLAAGCSMIIKGPEETPASPAALIQAFSDAGLPEGVLNLVYGNPAEISEYLIANPIIRKVTFTGSTSVGKHLASLAGQYMKRVTMELGGHAPVILCDDADVELAVKSLGFYKFRNAGQVCISPTRFLVHSSIEEEFSNAMAKAAAEIKVGDGLAEDTQMGPLANSRRVDAIQYLVQDAMSKGAKVVTGGHRIGATGYYWAPTVMTNVHTEARIFNEEPFGPVAAVQKFDGLEDAISEANRLAYGLAGYAFTRSLKNADLLTRSIEVGMLWINMPAMPSAEMPFGGIKESGFGSEGGPEALDSYLVTRSIAIRNA